MEIELQLLQEAANEIKALRMQNKLMAVRLEMFDNCMMLFNSRPIESGRGMSPDIVWEIEKRVVEQTSKKD